MSLKRTSRLISLCLCLTLFLSLAGCIKDSGTVKTDEPAEQISFGEKTLPLPEGMGYATAQCLLEDKLFTGGMGSEAPAAGIVELENGETSSIPLPDKIGYIYALCADGDYVAMLCGDPPETHHDAEGQVVNNPNAEGRLSILRYTPDGELVGDTELSGTYTESFILMTSCGGGYVLLSPDALVRIYADGNETGHVSREDDLPFSSMCYDGEELIVCRSELGKPKSEICSLNTDSFRLKALTKIEGMISGLGVWTDGRLLISDRLSKSVKLLDTETGNVHDLLFLYQLGLENERVLSVDEWSSGLVLFCSDQENVSIALPESEENSPTELILATDTAMSPLTLLVNRFNSENKDYKVKIKEYANDSGGVIGKDLLATELIAGNAPDIFVFFQTNYFPDNSGYFEDLLPWLDKDSEYGRETFVPSLFEALTEKGPLYYLPYEFELSSYISNPEALGGKMSFSIDELVELQQSLDPSQNLFDYIGGLNLRSMMSDLILNSFIDDETGTCSFDSPDFIRILELIKDITPASPPDENTSGLDDDNYLMKYYPLQSFFTISGLRKNFGDTYDFVEITQGEGNSSRFYPLWNFYMSSQSKHKEGVWEFIRSTFREDSPRHEFGGYLPAAQTVFQHWIDDSLAGELIDDFSGTKIELVQTDVDKLMGFFGKTRYMRDANNPVLKIIYEESDAYFAGARTAEETAKIIQSRASIYVAEQG